MMSTPAVLRAAWVGLLLTVAATLVLVRDATLTRADHMPSDTRELVRIESRSNRGEPTQTLQEMTTAQVSLCRMEVNSDVVEPVRPVEGTIDEFEFVLRPALGTNDRRQMIGCIEDWVLDHHQIDVLGTRRVAADAGRR